MSTETRPPGKTTVATNVLLTIARLTTQQVEGVSRMHNLPSGMSRIFHKGDYGEGVHIKIEDDRIFADIHVVLENDVNIREISRNVQNEVKRAFSEMVGMEVGRINVHIENIDYPSGQDVPREKPDNE
ncbi:MAG: Asp23/Gls24 family envelope stress response protein [Anaerolineales bacterium]|nr:Asp23/Gls24 family envelope stress response protein [Chloroflexota bacterium]MBL6981693.1 Asp23/Gls24 family envelope stress response protein [Anaerolineales bacterium]